MQMSLMHPALPLKTELTLQIAKASQDLVAHPDGGKAVQCQMCALHQRWLEVGGKDDLRGVMESWAHARCVLPSLTRTLK